MNIDNLVSSVMGFFHSSFLSLVRLVSSIFGMFYFCFTLYKPVTLVPQQTTHCLPGWVLPCCVLLLFDNLNW